MFFILGKLGHQL